MSADLVGTALDKQGCLLREHTAALQFVGAQDVLMTQRLDSGS